MRSIKWWLSLYIKDVRQEGKVKHLMKDIIAIVFFACISNANEWTEIHCFAETNEHILREYLELPNGIPSHDTIQRVMGIVPSESLQQLQQKWNELMGGNTGRKLRKILAIDGKVQRGNKSETQKANHIVSAVDDNGICFGQELVDDKTNEITAIPVLLENLNVKNNIITTDAMGCHHNVIDRILKGGADYVLALKGNQGLLHSEVVKYFDNPELLSSCAYEKVVEKAHSSIETREYWQTDKIAGLSLNKEWAGLKSIAMTRNTIIKNGVTTTEVRYFISSLPLNVKEIARAIRSHWMVESYHWQLDVTFREDANRTLDKNAAYNLNIIKKMAINTLKLLDISVKKMSMKLKRYKISMNFGFFFDMILEI